MSAPGARGRGVTDAAAADTADARRCRNCGAEAPGAYCPACGQETAVVLPTVRKFLREASGRLLAWDGRFWRTLAALLFRPGLLTQAYLAGRRRYYVRPARLFLAMSLFLFAVMRLEIQFADTSNLVIVDGAERATRPGGDAAGKRSSRISINVDPDANILVDGPDGYVLAKLRERIQRFNRMAPEQKADQLVDGALRYGSYVVILLLPMFAALVKLAYLGREARHPGRPRLYAEHLVFAAHLHTFAFLALIAFIVAPWTALRFAIVAWAAYYGFKAQKVVYGGSAWGRIVRDASVAVAYLVFVSLGIAGLVTASIVFR